MSTDTDQTNVECLDGAGRKQLRALRILAVVVLASLVAAVFFPVWNYEFIDFDTYPQVVKNEYIQKFTYDNIKHILTTRCLHSYYPFRTLTYLVDCQIWGLNPGGFKLTNVLIHFANVLLVFWLVLRLLAAQDAIGQWDRSRSNLAVATFAAGIVAIHPIVVEPVVWIPGREELLMTLGALGTIHFYISAGRWSQAMRTRRALACHGGAFVCCAAACLSNAVGAVIPLLAVAWDTLASHRPRLLRTIVATTPLWAISFATILAKRLGPGPNIATANQLSWQGRAMIALNAYWLQLKNILWPKDLALHYDWLFAQSFWASGVLLGIMALLLTLVVAWLFRRRPLVLFGLAWWGIALLPSMQVFPHHIHRADRFLYLPIMGLAVACVGMLRSLQGRFQRRGVAIALRGAAVAVLLLLAVASSFQLRYWRDSITTWNRCVDTNPNNVRAHNVLADNLVRAERVQEAFEHYEKALEIQPRSIENLGDFARELASVESELRDCSRAVELATKACEYSKWADADRRELLGFALLARGYELQTKGEFAQAIQDYSKALRVDPNAAAPALNLALLLATCRDEALRRPAEAIRIAEHGQRLMNPPDINSWLILATVYGQAGRFQAAAAATEEALRMAKAAKAPQLTDMLQRQLEMYRQAQITEPGP